MSSTKHITQGGQVFSYMLGMFMQVNKRIANWLILATLLILPLIFYLKVPTQEIRNGGLYWWLKLTAGGEKALYRVPPLYDVHFDDTVYHFTSAHILKDPYMVYAGDIVLQELWLSVVWTTVWVGVLALVIYGTLYRLGKRQANDDLVGGRALTEDVKAVAKQMRRQREASPITFDGLPLLLNSEVKNIVMHGTPGSGKSNAINKLLIQLRERGDMVLVFDKGCSLVKKHFQENHDKLLNPLDTRCENWDLWQECPTIPDFDTAANTLIPQSTKEDPFWTGSARTIFTAVGNKLRGDDKRSYNKLLRTLLAIDLKTLRAYVAETEASNLMEEKVEKTAISIRGVLTNYVKALRYLQGIERNGKPPFAIREWMKTVNEPKKRHGWLWITSNARQHESLKPLISMWLEQAANCLLEMGENPERRVWFIYDELASLHQLPGLKQALSEARKFGGCFVLGFQNKPQLDDIYGREKADSMMDLINSRLFFRSPDESVATWVRNQLGQQRAKFFSEQYSYGKEAVRDGVSFSKQQEDEYLVNYSDVQALPDLHCYVTLPGKYPVVKMAMRYTHLKAVAAEFTPRAVKESLDPEIDNELNARLAVNGLPEAVQDAIHRAVTGETVASVSTASVTTAPPITEPTAIKVAPTATAAKPATVDEAQGRAHSGHEMGLDNVTVDTETGEILSPRSAASALDDATAYEQYAKLRALENAFVVPTTALDNGDRQVKQDQDQEQDQGWVRW
ncbi:type IV conjugative transfer system coupling protein TraD [Providencia stuartii]|uniref:type IV conjugative transfer system coupling protein TraD n=1 Tax=Providencia stuartii TaxID=588 RepID=UPI001120C5D7|nr:type IV conjugative transfer system coupling protein TraD [Providencia stuartii]